MFYIAMKSKILNYIKIWANCSKMGIISYSLMIIPKTNETNSFFLQDVVLEITKIREFPGGLVVSILGFSLPQSMFSPWLRNWDSALSQPKKEEELAKIYDRWNFTLRIGMLKNKNYGVDIIMKCDWDENLVV